MTTTEVCYSEKDDRTFIMDVTYDMFDVPIKEKCVGWYWGKPNEVDTQKYRGHLEAEYERGEKVDRREVCTETWL